ncbi:LysR family transcriptional regulator [Marinomonas algicola]|uniref:LysR family transcriptional regulator n=1 Tax=Marinomonas algicola TaxID=2773454 RepID=UPI00174EBB63|nr:LysR family transcriptional regulator [Marinomonas algicola]
MKLDQVRAFIAVVETGSFRSAATALHKTQPSISASIKALEDKYDILLFDRDSYRPTLTPAGHSFFQQSKKLLSQVQQLESLGHNLSHGVDMPLRICLSQMSLTTDCMQKIKRFTQCHPNISLEITTGHMHGVQETLLKDQSDIAIGPRYGLDDRHAFTQLMTVKMLTVISPVLLEELRTLGVKNVDKIKQQQLYSTPQILVSNPSRSNKNSDGYQHLLTTGKRWFVSDFNAKKTLLLNGFGWARMPQHIIKEHLENGELVTISVEQFTSTSTLPVFMIRLRNQTQSHQANLFWSFMTS